jgi:hypothetical protein
MQDPGPQAPEINFELAPSSQNNSPLDHSPFAEISKAFRSVVANCRYLGFGFPALKAQRSCHTRNRPICPNYCIKGLPIKDF